MQTPKARSGTSEVPQRVSPRPARKLKPTALDTDSVSSSSSQSSRIPKERSPKVAERKSPRSPVPEKRRPSRIPELESQIAQFQEELKQAREQLCSSESGKKQAQLDVEDSKKQVLALSSKLEESQQQLRDFSTSEEDRLQELQKISFERDQAWQSELEAVQKQHSVDSTALASAIDEIHWLRIQLEMVAASEAEQTKHAESANGELQMLRGNLEETLSLVENMKTQLKDCKESENKAQELVSETLLQLETAKTTVESLRMDGAKAVESYNSIASELEQSRSRVNFLEGLVSKLREGQSNGEINVSSTESCANEEELVSLKAEVKRLRSALEAVETKYHEEQIKGTVQIRNAQELMEQMKSGPSAKEAELEAELKKAKADIEELKANLMDKETELQGITEENEGLSMKLEKRLSGQREYEIEKELKKLKDLVADLKANLMDKETELQSIAEENKMLKSDKSEISNYDTEVEAARSAEREALVKLGVATQEAEMNGKRAARVAEQLDAAQAANAEVEAELRRLKVQTEQWRKAAEAAAAMLSAGNNNGGRLMERTGSLDSNYSPVVGKFGSLYADDVDDDDLLKKKNGNVLKKIGVLWKKPHK